MIKMKWWAAAACAAVLGACGGGGGNPGTSPFGSGTSTTASSVSSLVVQLGQNRVSDNPSDSVSITVTATDANNNVVADAPVQISADSATIVADSPTTDANGKVTGSAVVGANPANRTVTVTASSGSAVATATFQVTGATITSTVIPSTQLTPGTNGSVNYRVRDTNDNPLFNKTVSVTAFGATTTGTTDVNGSYVFSYTAPSAAGTYSIDASAVGATASDTITVTTAATAPPAVPADSILSASVQASPSVVAVNATGGTDNQSAIRALFLGANNAPIPNVRVRFDLAGDLNNIGGTFTTGGTNPVYANSAGVATTAYVPGATSSPTDGLTIRACYGYTDADLANNACPYSTTTTVTVANEPVSVSIGTDRKLIDNTLTYIQKFVVTVVDSSGRAKSGVQITPSVDILRFGKGQWTRSSSAWTLQPAQWFRDANSTPIYLEDPRPLAEQISDPAGAPTIDPAAACWNEDRNRNGVLEAAEDSKTSGYSLAAGGNGNGKLDPAKSDIAISIVGDSKTDAAGKVTIQIEYAKNLGSWLEYKILVSAGGISGTEGRATWTDVLEVLDSDAKAEAAPPFQFSRYGVLPDCSNPQ